MKYIVGLILTLSISACATPNNPSKGNTGSKILPPFNVQSLSVTVPGELTVSHANRYLPPEDIVWREDPPGDRKEQVQTIMLDAIKSGVSQVKQGRPVNMEVTLIMFHALTEKARYSVGGRHNIQFEYILRDARTGDMINDVEYVDAKLKAYGGEAAIVAMAEGQTQKVRISNHIRNLMYQRMSGKSYFLSD